MVLHKRIVILAPPLTEYENGFGLWISKITKLAQELSITILIICNDSTEIAVDKFLKKSKLTASIKSKSFTEWEDFLVLSRHIHEDDLLVLVSARKGATSYSSILDNLPFKLEKHFAVNSKLVIYPQQFVDGNISEYDDFSSEPLNKGIEAIQKIGKGISSVLKSKNND
jgi:hypothetical protein